MHGCTVVLGKYDFDGFGEALKAIDAKNVGHTPVL